MMQVQTEVSDYQKYLFARDRKPKQTIIFVWERETERFTTFGADAQRVASMLDRRTVLVERQPTIQISADDMRGLIRRADMVVDYVDGRDCTNE